MDFRSFSDALVILVLTLSAGCVTVRAEQKEHLAHPAMTFGSEGHVQSQEDHVLTNREGTFGASGTSGGGCGCN